MYGDRKGYSFNQILLLIYQAPTMFINYLDWNNSFVAYTLLVTATVLSFISWMLGASGIFALLYMLLALLGFLNIFWNKEKASTKIESIRLDPLKYKSNVNREYKESIMKCKVLTTELLTSTHIITEQEIDKKSRNPNEISPDSFLEKSINILEPENTTEVKSPASVFEEDTDTSSLLQDEILVQLNINNLHVHELLLIDQENKESNIELSQADRRANGNVPNEGTADTDLERNQPPEDFIEIIDTNNEKNNGYKYEKLQSHEKYSLHTDCIVMPPVSIKDCPNTASVWQNKTNKTTSSKYIMKREMSPEPSTCFPRLCMTLLSESNVNSPVFKIHEQPCVSTFRGEL